MVQNAGGGGLGSFGKVPKLVHFFVQLSFLTLLTLLYNTLLTLLYWLYSHYITLLTFLYFTHFTLLTLLYSLYFTLLYSLYFTHFTLLTLLYSLYFTHFTLLTLLYSLYFTHFTLLTLLYSLYLLYLTHFTSLYYTHFTLFSLVKFTLHYFALLYLILPYLTLSYLILPYLTLSYLILPYLTLTYLNRFCLCQKWIIWTTKQSVHSKYVVLFVWVNSHNWSWSWLVQLWLDCLLNKRLGWSSHSGPMMTGHINCSVPKWNISNHLEGQKINMLREGQAGEGGGVRLLGPEGQICFFLNEPSLNKTIYFFNYFFFSIFTHAPCGSMGQQMDFFFSFSSSFFFSSSFTPPTFCFSMVQKTLWGVGLSLWCDLVLYFLQCIAVHCIALQYIMSIPEYYITVHYIALQYVTVCCSTLPCLVVHCRTWQCIIVNCSEFQWISVNCSEFKGITVHYSTLQYFTVLYSALLCITVNIRALQCSITVPYSTLGKFKQKKHFDGLSPQGGGFSPSPLFTYLFYFQCKKYV